jgi:hypothetical protein
VFLPAIQSAADDAQELFTTINQSLQDGLQPNDIETIGKKVAEKLSDGMRKITEYLPQVIKTVTEVLSKLISFAVEYLPKLMPMLMDAAVKLLQGALKAITDNIAKISETVSTLIKSFVKFIVENLPAIIKVAIDLMIALAKGLVSAIPEVIKALPQIIAALISGLGSAVKGFVEVGGQLVAGLWQGIQGAAGWVWEKISGWISGIWKDIKGFFGIKSPSKLMETTIGKPIAQGIAVGITGNSGLIDDAIKDLAPDAGIVLDVNRRFNDFGGSAAATRAARSVVTLSDSAISQIIRGFRDALSEQGETVLMMNDREMGRYVRKVALA